MDTLTIDGILTEEECEKYKLLIYQNGNKQVQILESLRE